MCSSLHHSSQDESLSIYLMFVHVLPDTSPNELTKTLNTICSQWKIGNIQTQKREHDKRIMAENYPRICNINMTPSFFSFAYSDSVWTVNRKTRNETKLTITKKQTHSKFMVCFLGEPNLKQTRNTYVHIDMIWFFSFL